MDRGTKLFLTPISIIEFDTFVSTHGPGTSITGKLYYIHADDKNMLHFKYLITAAR
jgi:hypothetical protein